MLGDVALSVSPFHDQVIAYKTKLYARYLGSQSLFPLSVTLFFLSLTGQAEIKRLQSFRLWILSRQTFNFVPKSLKRGHPLESANFHGLTAKT